MDLFGPSSNETRIYPSASVLHFRYASDPERPWHGISPLGYARATGKLAANLELRLAEEAVRARRVFASRSQLMAAIRHRQTTRWRV